MRNLLVHIGTHKTGTSSIQRFIRDRREALAGLGLFVPESGATDPQSGQHNLAWELYGDERFDPSRGTVGDLLGELERSGAERALVSAEDLEFLVAYPAVLTGFDQRLRRAGWEPTYIVYFRKPESYVVSLYGTLRARHKVRRNFVGFLWKVLKQGSFRVGPEFYEFSRTRFCERWRAATGPDSLVVIDFDESAAGGGSVVTLLRVAGIGDPELLAAAREMPAVNRGKRRSLAKLIMRMGRVRAALAAVSGGQPSSS